MQILVWQFWDEAPDSAFLINHQMMSILLSSNSKVLEHTEKKYFTKSLNHHKSFCVKILQNEELNKNTNMRWGLWLSPQEVAKETELKNIVPTTEASAPVVLSRGSTALNFLLILKTFTTPTT